jgi:hypothetical protein
VTFYSVFLDNCQTSEVSLNAKHNFAHIIIGFIIESETTGIWKRKEIKVCSCCNFTIHIFTINSYIKDTCTDNGQKYLHTSNFPYIFHIKLKNFRNLSWSQFTPDFDNFYINKNRILCSFNFKIIFYDKHFENIQAKHTTELISFKIQCFDSTYASKSYFKIITMNYISFCFPW